ncbi:MAG: M20/M25/M40 family metallo-hydrolase [bacterium]|nr:M20/M25/M40 family metallo-hydrolase [bacterium]
MLVRLTGVLLLLAILQLGAAYAETPDAAQAKQTYLQRIVERLSSDDFEGRRVGEDGGNKSFNYLYKEMVLLGLIEPGPVPNVHTFDVTRGIKVVGPTELKIADAQLTFGTDYDIALFSGGGTVTDAPLVFAGYGIVAPELNWNDYKDIDVRGAVVVIVRGEPQANDKDSRFSGDQPSTFADLRRKASTARDLGAAALLILNNPMSDWVDSLPEQRATYSAANFDIPAVHVKRAILEPLLKSGAGHDLRTLLQAMDRYGMPASSALPGTASLILQVDRDLVQGRNLVGVIPGTHPELRKQYIVIGAHYDHLGIGGTESLAPELFGQFHHGADDNASGVAAVLEIARRVCKSPLRRSVLVCFFDAEEIGTVGSRYLVDDLPVEQIYAMLNFDMVGRMRNNELVLGGTGTAELLEIAAKAALNSVWSEQPDEAKRLVLRQDASGFGASDHMNFVQKKVPSLFFFTGSHEDYHKPSDTPEKINYDGIEMIVGFADNVVRGLDIYEDPLEFVEITPEHAPQRNRGKLKVTMGTIPSYIETPGLQGMALGDVVKDGPADKAGLKGGDVIVRIGEKKVSNIYDFMYAMEAHESGEVVEVEVLRDEESIVVQVTLGARGVEE